MVIDREVFMVQLTPRRFPEITAAIPPKKLPKALDLTLNQTTRIPY